jgi:hypothetical protein
MIDLSFYFSFYLNIER